MQTTPKLIETSPTQYSVNIVMPDQIWAVWPSVKDFLLPAIKLTGGRMSEESAFVWLCAGQFHLWIVEEESVSGCRVKGALVTEMRTYPTGLKTVNVLLLGGEDTVLWLDLWPKIQRWALERGCTRAELTGRKGWVRTLRDWRETMVNMEKDLL